MQHLRICAETLETERRVITEEYHTYMNNPVARAFLQFRRAFFGEHPYALGPLGDIADIEAISSMGCHSLPIISALTVQDTGSSRIEDRIRSDHGTGVGVCRL